MNLKKYVFGITAIGLSAYLAAIGFTVYRAVQFRRFPRTQIARELFASEWPHNVIGRSVIFARGRRERPGYVLTLRDCVYRPSLVADNRWNRWILERDFTRMTAKDRLEFLPRYPLSPSAAMIPAIIEGLNAGVYENLRLVARSADARVIQAYDSWVENQLLRDRDPEVFLNTAPYLVGLSSLKHAPAQLFDVFWPGLDEEQRERLLDVVAPNIPIDSDTTDGLYRWATASLATAPRTDTWARFVGRFAISTKRRQEVVDAFVGQIGAADWLAGPFARDLPQAAQEELWTKWERAFGRTRPSLGLAVLRLIVARDLKAAETLAAPIVNAPDSPLRKGVIVVLAQHDSALGKAHVEDAFTGETPRATMFTRVSDYLYTSPGQTYVKLAGHDYLETGKRWPPVRADGRSAEEEAKGWRAFIDRYPWFPGTDDAYYRLAYLQFLSRHYDEALSTIQEFSARLAEDVQSCAGSSEPNWKTRCLADDDAAPYVAKTLRATVTSDRGDSSGGIYAPLRAVLMQPLGRRILEGGDFQPLIEGYDWLAGHPAIARLLYASEDEIRVSRRIAEACVGKAALEDRLEAALTLLVEHKAAQAILYEAFRGDVDDGEGGQAESAGAAKAWAGAYLAEALDRSSDGPPSRRRFYLFSWTLVHVSKDDSITEGPFSDAYRKLARFEKQGLPEVLWPVVDRMREYFPNPQ